MKNLNIQHVSPLIKALGTLGLLVFLISCSSSNDSSPSPSPTSASGVITGFGSVFVNGIEYDTTNASIFEEGTPTTEDALAVGMVVAVQGTVNDDGTTGTATRISYDDNVEGIVLSNTIAVDGKLDVMGQIINVDGNTTFESHVAGINQPSDIVAGNVVEVSGYTSGNGTIFATRIEVKTATYSTGYEIEVKGIIEAGVTATEFMIGTLTIDYSTAQLDDLPALLVAGMHVEAHGISGIDIATNTMIASKVELEDHDMDDNEGSEVEIEGIVTAVVSDTEFEINGRSVIHNDNTEFENGTAAGISEGVRLEVEGTIDASGTLLADEIEFRQDAEIEVDAFIDAIDLDNKTVTIFGISFQVNNHTTMHDESAADIRFFSLSDLATNDRVELHASIDAATGTLVTTSLERQDNDMSDLEIQGPTDADVANGATSFTMFGVTVDLLTNSLTISATPAGSEVELTGTFSGGQFIATAIDDDDHDDDDDDDDDDDHNDDDDE